MKKKKDTFDNLKREAERFANANGVEVKCHFNLLVEPTRYPPEIQTLLSQIALDHDSKLLLTKRWLTTAEATSYLNSVESAVRALIGKKLFGGDSGICAASCVLKRHGITDPRV